MLLFELFLWLLLFIGFYAYVGYGILAALLVRFPKVVKVLPKPKLKRMPNSIQLSNEPRVSLIISLFDEEASTIKEKITNTLELDYPQEKLEVIFAAAITGNNDTIRTLNDFLMNDSVETGLTSSSEELYVRFSDINKLSSVRSSQTLEMISDRLSSVNISSESLTNMPFHKLDEYARQFGRQNGVKFFMTKDIERKGKIHQVNRTIKQATGEVVVFTDANTMLNREALRNIVKHFRNDSVGCVAGEKRVKSNKDSTSGEGEGLYWKYESFLKKIDSKLWCTVGAAGELFAVRKELLNKGIPENAIIEDFVLSMKIAADGYRVIYEHQACATEEPAVSVKAEYMRKRRITAGGFQAIWWLRGLLNPIKYGVLSFQYISHRVLRWAVVPFSLPLIFALSVYLSSISPVYTLILVCQILFYSLAFVGLLLELNNKKKKIFSLPLFFVMMNTAAFAGLYRILTGKQTVIWDKVKRINSDNKTDSALCTADSQLSAARQTIIRQATVAN